MQGPSHKEDAGSQILSKALPRPQRNRPRSSLQESGRRNNQRPNGDNTNLVGTHALECRLEGSHIGDGIVDGFDVPNVSSLLMVAQKSCALPEEVKARRNIRGGKVP